MAVLTGTYSYMRDVLWFPLVTHCLNISTRRQDHPLFPSTQGKSGAKGELSFQAYDEGVRKTYAELNVTINKNTGANRGSGARYAEMMG